jgi:sirohydrochlorin ferrochelatase
VNTGVIVFAHGSRVEPANEAVRIVAEQLAQTSGEHVRAAFLELGEPSLEHAAEQMAEAGVQRIIVLPYFLTLGLHMERDLPRIVADITRKHPGVEMVVAPPLDGHPALVDILVDRVHQMQSETQAETRYRGVNAGRDLEP